ncbi:hypothetical protein THASP1DRAFT_25550 [Thamnocephalis sphaerospora]|uniref:Uncharacterized protein n=1 Tax=Thamnocephalis sphaerospora TaxID=78915 RepID=A0A4P9XKS8_9FUNG|nr:hypothetical protein THASP1DRAFT_25550 [Thamnocephalis sphaerospora]|eukprot:RKP06051.1 hypothetical protein THASP1DRAFT_25550 [Thamnocephalis sphaerospora]
MWTHTSGAAHRMWRYATQVPISVHETSSVSASRYTARMPSRQRAVSTLRASCDASLPLRQRACSQRALPSRQRHVRQAPLKCDDECALLERNRRLAEALQIEQGTTTGFGAAHEYESDLLEYSHANAAFVSKIELELAGLLQGSRKAGLAAGAGLGGVEETKNRQPAVNALLVRYLQFGMTQDELAPCVRDCMDAVPFELEWVTDEDALVLPTPGKDMAEASLVRMRTTLRRALVTAGIAGDVCMVAVDAAGEIVWPAGLLQKKRANLSAQGKWCTGYSLTAGSHANTSTGSLGTPSASTSAFHRASPVVSNAYDALAGGSTPAAGVRSTPVSGGGKTPRSATSQPRPPLFAVAGAKRINDAWDEDIGGNVRTAAPQPSAASPPPGFDGPSSGRGLGLGVSTGTDSLALSPTDESRGFVMVSQASPSSPTPGNLEQTSIGSTNADASAIVDTTSSVDLVPDEWTDLLEDTDDEANDKDDGGEAKQEQIV